MTKLSEIERELNSEYETIWVPKYGELLIRAVRQLGAERTELRHAAGELSQYVLSGIEKRVPVDPDVLELLEDGPKPRPGQ